MGNCQHTGGQYGGATACWEMNSCPMAVAMETVVWLGAIFLPGNRVTEHPSNGEEAGKFLFEVIPGKRNTDASSAHSSHME
ncbi:hypothetical protein SRHO_G00224080 [Serrasalmus rhombeus]